LRGPLYTSPIEVTTPVRDQDGLLSILLLSAAFLEEASWSPRPTSAKAAITADVTDFVETGCDLRRAE
jgi:hypothetical protein